MPTRAEHRAFWREHVERHARSELSAKAYAEQHGLAVANLYAARKRFSASSSVDENAPPHFARVAPSAPATPPTTQRVGCRLHLPGGGLLELDLPCDGLPSLLASVVAQQAGR